MIESKKLQDIHDNFSGTTNDIQPYYSSEKRLDLNFGSLDPMLIDRANKSSLNIPDLILPDSTLYGEATYKINLNIALTYQQKTNLVSQIFKDPTLWKTVNALNNPNNPDALYGKDTPNRIETWYKKCPDAQEPKELAVAVGAYLMK